MPVGLFKEPGTAAGGSIPLLGGGWTPPGPTFPPEAAATVVFTFVWPRALPGPPTAPEVGFNWPGGLKPPKAPDGGRCPVVAPPTPIGT